MPEDIGTARQLWYGVAGLSVVQALAGIAVLWGTRGDMRATMLEDLRKSDPTVPEGTVDLMLAFAFGIAGLLAVGLACLTALFAFQLGRGKLWARTVLTVVAIWMAMGTVATLLAFASVQGVAMIVAGAASIVQGVLAVGAAYLSYRPDSTRYFLLNRR
ncbi:hypothetical protein ACWEVD_24910 [Nocardia thailandica]|uniref:Uncharacterized protein n=1 Tax=Nocardia thailandica TaxID=257275 RepID=A0ABW6PTB3_9NOCA|nr:hypothetical protein [Nocardia thailandica]